MAMTYDIKLRLSFRDASAALGEERSIRKLERCFRDLQNEAEFEACKLEKLT